MKIKIGLIIALTFLFINGYSQNNQTTINYSIGKSLREQVGGDLVINDGTFCVEKNNNLQKLFEATSHGTLFIDINNRGGGNSCVTLVVETATSTIKTVIPEDAQSGVLKFNKVKNAYLTIVSRPNDSNLLTATSSGVATVWF